MINKRISATRKKKDNVNKKLELIYRGIFSTLIQKANLGSLSTPSFTICNSINRIAEYMKTDSEDIIIYDQYLGQTFNKLNKLYYEQDGTSETVTYLLKLYSEFHYLLSDIKTSGYFALQHLSKKTQEAKKKSVSNDTRTDRAITTNIQELFIIAHEIAHYKFSNSKDKYLFKEKRKFLESDVRSSMIIDLTDDFVEECLCDDFAAKIIIEFMWENYKIPEIKCLEAIFIGIHHLEIINLLKIEIKTAVLEIKDESKNNSLFNSAIRKSNFRTVFSNLSLSPEEFITINEKYDAQIFYPYIETYPHFFEKSKSYQLNIELEKINEIVLKL